MKIKNQWKSTESKKILEKMNFKFIIQTQIY
jgi:hypothetical protein